MLQIIKKPGAWICSNEKERQTRGRIKIHQNSKLYLEDGDEFEIELFNPTQKNIKADITIDGKSIGSGLILRSGQRVYLECFPDNKKKFTYKTYEVEDSEESKEAISENGFVSVKFHEEITKFFQTGSIKRSPNWCPNWYPNYDIYCNINNTRGYYNSGGFGGIVNDTFTTNYSTDSTFDLSDVLSSGLKSIDISGSSTIETGQVDGGSSSIQEFESVSMNFDYYVLNEIKLQLLPMSQKPIEVSGFKTQPKPKLNKVKTSDKLEELLKLKDLLDLGLIDRSEFDLLKSEII